MGSYRERAGTDLQDVLHVLPKHVWALQAIQQAAPAADDDQYTGKCRESRNYKHRQL
jgi:hypothetical protein